MLAMMSGSDLKIINFSPWIIGSAFLLFLFQRKRKKCWLNSLFFSSLSTPGSTSLKQIFALFHSVTADNTKLKSIDIQQLTWDVSVLVPQFELPHYLPCLPRINLEYRVIACWREHMVRAYCFYMGGTEVWITRVILQILCYIQVQTAE